MLGCYQGLGGAEDTGAGAGSNDGASEDAGSEDGTGDDGAPVEVDEVGRSGLRRLTAAEYDQTVMDLLGVDPQSELLLPEDLRTPYDNDYTIQIVSEALINGADLLASDVAETVVGDPALRDAVMPCAPTGPGDEACLRTFIAEFGRRALRRTLTEEEIARYAGFIDHAVEGGDFWIAVDSVLRAFLQHTEFLYRIEVGTPVDGEPGVFRLNGNEVATRLSYLFLGSTPPDWLLDAAENGELGGGDEIRAAATMLLADERARSRVVRFHAMWMGFERAGVGGELGAAMQAETRALLERTLFDEIGPWKDLLRANETFVNDALAEHYGLQMPGSDTPQWVPYGDSGRQGLLSHASFLSVGAKFDDTSPTIRGLIVRENLFCQEIPDPPDNVNTDDPPAAADPDACKVERYAAHRENGGCAGCHELMDPIGFGLENYDATGRFRATELDRPDCPIDGNGSISGVGDFNGPAGLANLMVQSPELDQCVVTQVYRFAMGRFALDEPDLAYIQSVVGTIGDGELQFDQMLLELVASPSFRHRREEEV